MHQRTTVSLLLLLLTLPVRSGHLHGQEPDTATSDTTADRQSAGDSTTAAVLDSLTSETIPQDTTLLGRAGVMIEDLTLRTDSLVRWEQTLFALEGEEFELSRATASRYIHEMQQVTRQVLGVIIELQSAQVSVDSLRESLGDVLEDLNRLYQRSVEHYLDRVRGLTEQRDTTRLADLDHLQALIRQSQARIDTSLAGQTYMLTMADSVGLDTSGYSDVLERFLEERAEVAASVIQVSKAERDALHRELKAAARVGAPDSEIAEFRTRSRLAEQRLGAVTSSLLATADLLDLRGLETTSYRRLAIEASGEITGDILRPGVFVGVAQAFIESIAVWIKDNAATLLVRLMILVGITMLFRIGFAISWWLFTHVRLVRLPSLIADLARRMVRPFATVAGLATGLWVIGVDPTALLAGLGVAGVIVGLALQDSMSNLAAGFFIIATRPFDEDDLVEAAGVLGKVKAIGLANTTIVTLDYRRLYVPNRKIWSEVIENRSAESLRRVQRKTRISYQADLDQALEVIRELLAAHEMVLDDPEPFIYVSDLADSWVEIKVWPYVKAENWWAFYMELPRLIRNRFQERGIEFPLPGREVQVSGPIDPSSVGGEG